LNSVLLTCLNQDGREGIPVSQNQIFVAVCFLTPVVVKLICTSFHLLLCVLVGRSHASNAQKILTGQKEKIVALFFTLFGTGSMTQPDQLCQS